MTVEGWNPLLFKPSQQSKNAQATTTSDNQIQILKPLIIVKSIERSLWVDHLRLMTPSRKRLNQTVRLRLIQITMFDQDTDL